MTTHKVKPCWDSEYYGVACLESEDEFGFFKTKGDVRPSSCHWIRKHKERSRQMKLK